MTPYDAWWHRKRRAECHQNEQMSKVYTRQETAHQVGLPSSKPVRGNERPSTDFEDRGEANQSQASGHVCTHRSAREDSRARPWHTCTITVPLWSVGSLSHSTPTPSRESESKKERPRRASANRSDKGSSLLVHRAWRPRRTPWRSSAARVSPPPRAPPSSRDAAHASSVSKVTAVLLAVGIISSEQIHVMVLEESLVVYFGCRCAEALPAPCEGRLRGHIGLRRRAHRGSESQGTCCVLCAPSLSDMNNSGVCMQLQCDVPLTHAVGRR